MTEIEPAARVVLIPVDKSSHSDHAVSWATLNLVLPSDDIHLMTVIAPSPDPSTVGAQFSLLSPPYDGRTTGCLHRRVARGARRLQSNSYIGSRT